MRKNVLNLIAQFQYKFLKEQKMEKQRKHIKIDKKTKILDLNGLQINYNSHTELKKFLSKKKYEKIETVLFPKILHDSKREDFQRLLEELKSLKIKKIYCPKRVFSSDKVKVFLKFVNEQDELYSMSITDDECDGILDEIQWFFLRNTQITEMNISGLKEEKAIKSFMERNNFLCEFQKVHTNEEKMIAYISKNKPDIFSYRIKDNGERLYLIKEMAPYTKLYQYMLDCMIEEALLEAENKCFEKFEILCDQVLVSLCGANFTTVKNKIIHAPKLKSGIKKYIVLDLNSFIMNVAGLENRLLSDPKNFPYCVDRTEKTLTALLDTSDHFIQKRFSSLHFLDFENLTSSIKRLTKKIKAQYGYAADLLKIEEISDSINDLMNATQNDILINKVKAHFRGTIKESPSRIDYLFKHTKLNNLDYQNNHLSDEILGILNSLKNDTNTFQKITNWFYKVDPNSIIRNKIIAWAVNDSLQSSEAQIIDTLFTYQINTNKAFFYDKFLFPEQHLKIFHRLSEYFQGINKLLDKEPFKEWCLSTKCNVPFGIKKDNRQNLITKFNFSFFDIDYAKQLENDVSKELEHFGIRGNDIALELLSYDEYFELKLEFCSSNNANNASLYSLYGFALAISDLIYRNLVLNKTQIGPIVMSKKREFVMKFANKKGQCSEDRIRYAFKCNKIHIKNCDALQKFSSNRNALFVQRRASNEDYLTQKKESVIKYECRNIF